MMYVVVSVYDLEDAGHTRRVIDEVMFVTANEELAKEFCRINPGHVYYTVQEL